MPEIYSQASIKQDLHNYLIDDNCQKLKKRINFNKDLYIATALKEKVFLPLVEKMHDDGIINKSENNLYREFQKRSEEFRIICNGLRNKDIAFGILKGESFSPYLLGRSRDSWDLDLFITDVNQVSEMLIFLKNYGYEQNQPVMVRKLKTTSLSFSISMKKKSELLKNFGNYRIEIHCKNVPIDEYCTYNTKGLRFDEYSIMSHHSLEKIFLLEFLSRKKKKQDSVRVRDFLDIKYFWCGLPETREYACEMGILRLFNIISKIKNGELNICDISILDAQIEKEYESFLLRSLGIANANIIKVYYIRCIIYACEWLELNRASWFTNYINKVISRLSSNLGFYNYVSEEKSFTELLATDASKLQVSRRPSYTW
ncbi:hypothetical protein VCSRO97_3339 [Vibrio cholerae]|nr:hypothetical protein VCSRO97_3339 [Vibrio cholerae]